MGVRTSGQTQSDCTGFVNWDGELRPAHGPPMRAQRVWASRPRACDHPTILAARVQAVTARVVGFATAEPSLRRDGADDAAPASSVPSSEVRIIPRAMKGHLMLQIVISRSKYDRALRAFDVQPVATFCLAGSALKQIAGEPFDDLRDIVLTAPASGHDLTFERDPLRWARELPRAFTHGDLIA